MTAKSSSDHPNIVFIHAESMDGRKMGCMGHPAMRNATPYLDGLADNGVLFTNNYTNCPVCNPSRASMFTGKYPHYHHCWNNHEGLRPGTPILPDVLGQSGYSTAMIGPLDYQYGKHSIRDRLGSWTRAARILRPACRTLLPVVAENGSLYARDHQHTDQALSFLEKSAGRDQPFFLYLTTGLVHPAFQAEPRYMDRIDEDAIDIPPTLGPPRPEKHPVLQHIRSTKNCDKRFPEKMTRHMRHTYFAMIAALDDLVGRVLSRLDKLGLADSTYVVFSSDHGEMAGEQNQVLKRTMYEPSTHEPLIIRGPGCRRGQRVETPVSLVDLYPTFLDMAGVDYAAIAGNPGYAEALDGESLLPQLTGNAARQRDWAMSEYHGDRCCTGTFMLRRGDWKYVKYVGFEPQLFNVARDPWETTDLAQDEPAIVADMDGILAASFDCEAIDAQAKQYDRESFLTWRKQARAAGKYQETLAHVYSGFDRQCIEDLMPWRDEDEQKIRQWLGE